MILKEQSHVRFIYSEKTTNFCEISTLVLSYVVPVKSKVEILQNYVAFSEYMNFKCKCIVCINVPSELIWIYGAYNSSI